MEKFPFRDFYRNVCVDLPRMRNANGHYFITLSLFKLQTRVSSPQHVANYLSEGSPAFHCRTTSGPPPSRSRCIIRGESEKGAPGVNLCRKFTPRIASSSINSSGVAQLICFELRMPLVKRADKINETGNGDGRGKGEGNRRRRRRGY